MNTSLVALVCELVALTSSSVWYYDAHDFPVFQTLAAWPFVKWKFLIQGGISLLCAGWRGWCSFIQTWASVELSDWWLMLLLPWSLRDVVFRSGQPITTPHIVSLKLLTQICLWYVNTQTTKRSFGKIKKLWMFLLNTHKGFDHFSYCSDRFV